MDKDLDICPICDEGNLVPSTYDGELEYAGKHIEVNNLEHSICDSCGAAPVLPEQAKRNSHKYVDARRKVDGLLVSDQIRELRKAFGLTQSLASQLFGGGSNAFSKYERGEVVQSVAMDRLLRVTAHIPEALGYLSYISGISLHHEGYGGYSDTTRINMASISTNPIMTGHLVNEVVVNIAQWKGDRDKAA